MKAILVVGTRPNFIKSAPIYREMKTRGEFEIIFVNTGQHYDPEMADVFLKDLGLPQPHYNLQVGSASHGVQTGQILAGMDTVLLRENPDVVLVMGDTNTTLAGALAAYKLGFPLGHIEAGMREFIWRPEEINKKMADHCSDFCFCPTSTAVTNLKMEGIPVEKIFLTGDITYDVFLQNSQALGPAVGLLELYGFKPGEYILMTLHRAETVDNPQLLAAIVDKIKEIRFPVLFSVHPRTRKRLEELDLLEALNDDPFIRISPPLGYNDFISLMLSCRLVITDSSGTLKDAFYSRRPCVVVDDTTEYVELLEIGMTRLVGRDGKGLVDAVREFRSTTFMANSSPLGKGNCAQQIVDILLHNRLQRKV